MLLVVLTQFFSDELLTECKKATSTSLAKLLLINDETDIVIIIIKEIFNDIHDILCNRCGLSLKFISESWNL